MTRRDQWPMPPHLHTDSGAERRCGVEIEFIGFDRIDAIVEIVCDTFGGQVDERSDWHAKVHSELLGEVRIELDFRYLKQQGVQAVSQTDDDPARLQQMAQSLFNELVGAVARTVVPWEIVSAPLALSQLPQLDPLIDALRVAGAKGTHESIAYAFGVHFNPELPTLDAGCILRHLQAYMCLRHWLAERDGVDISRRLTPYIDDFDDAYVRRICAPDYRPDLATLIDDYLAANPTRNRSLDMLPLFAHLDEARVRAAVDDPRIQARPTFHYRLPNCEIDDPGWSLARPWSDWCKVEALADDHAKLVESCKTMLEQDDRDQWLAHCRQLVATL